MATRVVGLDLGSYGVRAVEMTLGGGEPTLERFAQLTLPPGAIRDGEVVDVAAVSAVIRRLWSEGGFKSKRVVVGVANQRVIVRLAEMPTMNSAMPNRYLFRSTSMKPAKGLPPSARSRSVSVIACVSAAGSMRFH